MQSILYQIEPALASLNMPDLEDNRGVQYPGIGDSAPVDLLNDDLLLSSSDEEDNEKENFRSGKDHQKLICSIPLSKINVSTLPITKPSQDEYCAVQHQRIACSAPVDLLNDDLFLSSSDEEDNEKENFQPGKDQPKLICSIPLNKVNVNELFSKPYLKDSVTSENHQVSKIQRTYHF